MSASLAIAIGHFVVGFSVTYIVNEVDCFYAFSPPENAAPFVRFLA